jgi:MraZ protein
MFSGASETNIDSQGRIVIPGNLKDYAKIDKKAVVIGAGDHIEIWDFDTWEDYSQRISQILSA